MSLTEDDGSRHFSLTPLTSINGKLRAGRSTLTLATQIYIGVFGRVGGGVEHGVTVGVVADVGSA